MRKIILAGVPALSMLLSTSSTTMAGDIAICHAGIIKLASFAQHVKRLRAWKQRGYDVDGLIEQQRRGGSEFFSSQIIVQEEQSGSGTFDLRLFHGITTARDYRNVTAWSCAGDDYPIVYFIGFRVRKISDDTIFVSREEGIVNVISLKAIDDKHFKVQVFEGTKELCSDIATECDPSVFYSRE